MRASIILPTYNRLERLRKVVGALEKQSYDRDKFEVIIVSDGSTDGTNEYLRQLQTPLRVGIVLQSNQGVAAARNQGVRLAGEELVIFIDDDVVPEPQLVAAHIASHQAHGRQLVVIGPMLTPADFAMRPWVQWEQAMLQKQYDAMSRGDWQPSARQFYTGNSSLRREHLLASGGFDASFRRAEDVELAYRLADRGLRFLFNPAAVGFHYAERSLDSWLAIPYVYGRNDVLFATNKGQAWILATVRREFRETRHPLLRWFVYQATGRERLNRLITRMAGEIAALGSRLGSERIPGLAYSLIFNTRYYHGFCEQLGGREQFLQLMSDRPLWLESDQPLVTMGE